MKQAIGFEDVWWTDFCLKNFVVVVFVVFCGSKLFANCRQDFVLLSGGSAQFVAHLEEVRQTSENVGQVINSLQDVFRLLSIMRHLGGIVVNKVRHVKARPGYVREKLESTKSAKPRARVDT